MKSWIIAALAAGLAAGVAQAAPAAPLPVWSGVWAPAEDPVLDPSALQAPENKGRGFFEMREFPPYNAEYEARYRQIIARNRAGKPDTDQASNCLPSGMPRMLVVYPVEFDIHPERTTMLFEQYSQVRRIWTDGRGHDPDPDPGFVGDSIGHWEGDTLVADTIGIRADLPFDIIGTPHSDALHIIERLRRTNADTIEDRLTFEDPKAFTKPWVVVRHYRRQPDWQIKELVCERNRNVPDANGAVSSGVTAK